ncbi:MAG TPA: hypothetical protein VG711_00910, partial [Phycisphaerales bacterium]|nr:hypothetical protein [Phycisphaerales bacterium]
MRQLMRLGAVIALTSLMTRELVAATVTWDGSCGGTEWGSTCGGGQTNWDRGIPGLTDTVSIPMGAPIVQLKSSIGMANLMSVFSGLRIGNTTLQIGGGGGFISNLNMDGTFATIQFMTPGGELGLQGNCRWSVGTISGNGTVFNSGS